MTEGPDFPTATSAIHFGVVTGVGAGIVGGLVAGVLFGSEHHFVAGVGVGFVWIAIFVVALGIGHWLQRRAASAPPAATVKSGPARSSFLRRLAASNDNFNANLAGGVLGGVTYAVLGTVYFAVSVGVGDFYHFMLCALLGVFVLVGCFMADLGTLSFRYYWRRWRQQG